MSCSLEVSNLYFKYQNKPVLQGLSLKLDQPGIVGLLGLNGEGKSTFLKILSGILPAQGHDITCQPESQQSQNPIGFLPERPLFYPELTVFENICFAARVQGVNKSSQQEYAQTALQQCQLEEREKQLAGTLSKGFQQRLGLAMSSVHQPPVLLLDEPTDGLDPQQNKETHQLIRQFAEKTIVLISSHRIDEISRLCKRLLILHGGRLQHDADLSDQQQREDIEQIFLRITSGVEA